MKKKKKRLIYEWHKHFGDGCLEGNRLLRQMMIALSMCAMLCEVTDVKVQEKQAKVVGCVHSILHKDLNMYYLWKHFISKTLTAQHKEQ
jgi:hypothetical protein